MTPTSRCEGRLLLHFHLLPTSGWDVVVDALVVVVHRHCQHLLGVRLADDVLVEVSVDLKQRDEKQATQILHLVSKEKAQLQTKATVFSPAILTFLGGGGGFCANASFTASEADSGSLLSPFLESVSDRTTKKWWHFSHLTNRVDAAKTKTFYKLCNLKKKKTCTHVSVDWFTLWL